MVPRFMKRDVSSLKAILIIRATTTWSRCASKGQFLKTSMAEEMMSLMCLLSIGSGICQTVVAGATVMYDVVFR